MALRCFQLIFRDMLDSDALLVMARGIGVRVLLTKFLKVYSASPGLVLVLNLRGEEQLLRDALLADGLRDTHLPANLDAHVSAPERKRAYAKGGCVMVTSRILIVDLLMHRILPSQVAGILVANAHRVGDQSPEAFILKLIKDSHPGAFVKGFSDDPETLGSGFNRVEKTMRALYTPKLYIWPRYHEILNQELSAVAPGPEVVELSLPLTPAQVTIQRSILQCMDDCITALRRATGSRIDISEFTVENGLFESFDVIIRRQLDPFWNTLKPRVKALVGDLKLFRKLLNYVVRYDAVSFFSFLDMVRANAIQQQQLANAAAARGGLGAGVIESEWLLSDKGEALVRAAKARLFSLAEQPGLHSPGTLPLLPEDAASSSGSGEPLWARRGTHLHVEEVVPGEPAGGRGGRSKGSKSSQASSVSHDVSRRIGLTVALETNPKWDLLAELMEEVSEAAAALDAKASASSGSPAFPSAARVLIAVKDERTAAQVQEVLAGGTDRLLRRGWERFLLKHAARSRRLRAAVLGSAPLAAAPGPRGSWDAVQAQLAGALPREVAELLAAAEVPGWKTAPTGGAAESGSGSAAAAPAPAPPSVFNPFAGMRPHVQPENRLLWKAAAVAIEAERQRLVKRHMRLLWLDSVVKRQASGSAATAPAQHLPSQPPTEVTVLDDEPVVIVEGGAAASAVITSPGSAARPVVLDEDEEDFDLSSLPPATQAQVAALKTMDLEELLASEAGLRSQLASAVGADESGAALLQPLLEGGPLHVPGLGSPTGVAEPRRFGGLLDIDDWTAGRGEEGSSDGLLLSLLQSGLLASSNAAGGAAASAAAAGDDADASLLLDGLDSAGVGLGNQSDDEDAAERMQDEEERELAAKLVEGSASGGGGEALGKQLQAALAGAAGVAGKKRAAGSAGTGATQSKRPRLEEAAASDSNEGEEEEEDDEGGAAASSGDEDTEAEAALAAAASAHRAGAATSEAASSSSSAGGASATGIGILLKAHRGGGGGGGKDKRKGLAGGGSGVAVDAPGAAAGPTRRSKGGGKKGQPPVTLVAPAGAPVVQAPAPGAPPQLRSLAGPAVSVTTMPAAPQVVVYPLSRADARMPLLSDFRPTFVIVYDPDPSFTRELEVYAATLGRGRPLRIYYLVYSASAEEQRYLSQLKKERDAFEKLIMAKAHMAPPPLSVSAAAAAAVAAPVVVRKGAVDGWGIRVHDEDLDGRAGGTAGALLALSSGAGSGALPGSGGGLVGRQRVTLANVRPLTVDIRWEDKGKRLVIVDMREFRAKLPLRLYTAGLNPLPATLEVGDFVLSPDMCVERKALPDLLGSLASGRLYSQAEAMTRYYKKPILCIEFDEDKPFALLPGDVPPDIDVGSPISKLVLLLIHFPTLRTLWCRDPTATATTFAALKQLDSEPDLATAIAVGTGAAPGGPGGAAGSSSTGEGAGFFDPEDLDPADLALNGGFSAVSRPVDGSSSASAAPLAAASSSAPRGEAVLGFDPRNLTGMEMLRRFPGVNAVNYKALAAAAGSLRGLAGMTKAQLTAAIGPSNGALLHNFLHAKHATAL